MKKLAVIFILLALIPSALADWFYNSQNIITSIDIKSYADIVTTSPDGYMQSAVVNMSFFPKQESSQELLKFSTSPSAEVFGDHLRFTWDRPEGRIYFGINANVETTNEIAKIREKIKFPVENIPKDLAQYTEPSQTIDSNDENIIRLGSDIINGEDDFYSAVFKVAQWTKSNVNYNLSTLTADASQKASWVLENRQGVCDEISTLFIALLRAVGIPARFVSGIAYTNSDLFPEKWGPHGWAEVYFPGYGWVPFDVTYGEFGWIDPTHIKFKESVDSNEPETYYQGFGRNANLKTRSLDIKTELISKTGYTSVPLDIEVFALKKSVDFGSYNLLKAVVENTNDFYYATEIHLSKPREIKIIGDNAKNVLLLPKEKKTLFWILKVDGNLEKGYSYTFPLVVSTLDNSSFQASFTANVRENHVYLDEIERAAGLLEEESLKKYSGNVVLGCEAKKPEFYEYESAKILCTAKNTGNVFIENADACFGSECYKISLGISQSKQIEFKINTSQIGVSQSDVTLRNSLVSKSAAVNFKVNDIPEIQVENPVFPPNVSYDSNFVVSFDIAKKSYSSPKDVSIIFTLNGVEKKWHIDELSGNKKISLRFQGSQLKYGTNTFKVNVYYYDSLGRNYNVRKEFSTEITNANLIQFMALSLNSLAGISAGTMAILLLSGTIVFILVVLWVFKRSKRD